MREPLRLRSNRLSTPIGEMIIVTDFDGNLRAIDWEDHQDRMLRLLHLHYGKMVLPFNRNTTSRVRPLPCEHTSTGISRPFGTCR